MTSKPRLHAFLGMRTRPWACLEPGSCLLVALVVSGVKVA
jgi:hypothetical protein